MTKSLFISNVAWTATNETLQQHLSSKGANVLQVNIIHDRETGRSRGFAFATVETQADMSSVTAAFNNIEFSRSSIEHYRGTPKTVGEQHQRCV